MVNKVILSEINNYRKLMGLPKINYDKIITEQQETGEVSASNLYLDSENDKLNTLLKKTNKTIEEIINSEVLTENEILILIEVSKLKNLPIYSEIMDSINNSETYKNTLKNEYKKLITKYGDKLKSDKEIPNFKYSTIIYNLTLVIAKTYNEKFVNAYKNIIDCYNDEIKDLWDDFELSGFALEYSKHILDNIDFYTFETPSKNYSGWKIYIYAEKSFDVVDILKLLENTLKNYGVVFKAATTSELKNGTNKGLIIYLPYEMVKNKNFKSFFNQLNSDLSSYNKGGSIEGSKPYNNKIHYLYEFNKKFKDLPKDGVTPSEVGNYYVPNAGGDYMKKINQPDIFIDVEVSKN